MFKKHFLKGTVLKAFIVLCLTLMSTDFHLTHLFSASGIETELLGPELTATMPRRLASHCFLSFYDA